MNHNTKLRNELKQAGASDSEVNELMRLTDSIKQLKEAKSMPKLPVMKFRRPAKWRLVAPLGLASVTGLVLGMAIVILSQATLPGNVLYPVQKFSDSVAVSLDPSYRGTVMMKRAQEVKQLIANHSNSNLVLATLSDYTSEASVYKSAYSNYAAFEYCKDSLQQAATMATSSERQAIQSSLSSLNDV
jgi:hypothetical protein